MEKILLTATIEDKDKRLDAFLTAGCEISRTALQGLIVEGAVLINGNKAAKNYRMKEGDSVLLTTKDAVALDTLPENIPIEIVYEDSHLLVVEKPRGMVVHPAPGNETGTLVNALLYHCGDTLSTINGVIRPGIVHRIDKDTSGLLVVAKDDKTHSGLSEQFEIHSIDREYMAIVHGTLKECEGTIDAPIGRHSVDRKKMCITDKNSRNAVTHYEIVEQFTSFALVKLKLQTGRTHQIRVHMASIGHPVAGDPVYGPSRGVKLGGQCLHAAVLGFTHPVTGERLRFESALPPYFTQFLAKLRMQ